jgi:hypothetical protein
MGTSNKNALKFSFFPGNAEATNAVAAGSARIAASPTDGDFLRIAVNHGGVANGRSATVFLGDPQKNNFFKVKDGAVVIDFRTATVVVKGSTATVPISLTGMW